MLQQLSTCFELQFPFERKSFFSLRQLNNESLNFCRNESEKVNITPSIELYNSLTSDKVENKRTPAKAPVRAFGKLVTA